MSTLYHCPKCNTRNHWATDICPKDAALQELPGAKVHVVCAVASKQPAEAAPIRKAREWLKRAGRPKLSRPKEEKRKRWAEYMRRYRERKGVLADGGKADEVK